MSNNIEGVKIKPLRRIPDERGCIMHMMRNDDEEFEQFGEIYFSEIYPQIIKGWHLHTRMTLNYCVPVGMIKLVLFDDRPNSSTKGKLQELFIGKDNYLRVQIPKGVWNGYKCVGAMPALVANCATHAHDPEEMLRKDPFSPEIPYKWEVKCH